MTPLIRELITLDADVALEFLWFDLGRLPRYTFSWSELALQRLPYDHCAIVGIDKQGDKFLVLAYQAENQDGFPTIALAAYGLLADRFQATPTFAVIQEPGGCRLANLEEGDAITREQAAPFVGILSVFLSRVHPVGYRGVPKTNSLTNKRRIAKGRPPLIYDWHTVTIEPPQPRGECLGGTHASPRQHDRRGHWRTCSSGKRVWVRHCTVGNAALGAVFKDYRVEDAGGCR